MTYLQEQLLLDFQPSRYYSFVIDTVDRIVWNLLFSTLDVDFVLNFYTVMMIIFRLNL